MNYDRNLSANSLVFSLTLQTAFLKSYIGNLYLYVNASDTMGLQGKSNVLTLAIDNNGPSLTSYTLNATYKDLKTTTYWVFNTSQVPNLVVLKR